MPERHHRGGSALSPPFFFVSSPSFPQSLTSNLSCSVKPGVRVGAGDGGGGKGRIVSCCPGTEHSSSCSSSTTVDQILHLAPRSSLNQDGTAGAKRGPVEKLQ